MTAHAGPSPDPRACRRPPRRATSPHFVGRSRRHDPGYVLLALLAGVTVLTLAGFWLLPTSVSRISQEQWSTEEKRLQDLASGLRQAIRQQLAIPDATTWDTTIAAAIGANLNEVRSVLPSFPNDTTTRRVFLIDPALGSGVLPYTQTLAGLTGTQTNLTGASARVMIVSNTKRGLSLPVTSGTPATNAFNAIWDWGYNPSTQAPPSGWSSAWTGNGEYLHVARISLSDLFSTVTLKTVNYGIASGLVAGGSTIATNTTLTQVSPTLLNGTLLAIAQTNGSLFEILSVDKDLSIDLTPTNTFHNTPVVYFPFSEAQGSTTAINHGVYGSSWNGTATAVTFGDSGPELLLWSFFSSSRKFAPTFNGTTSVVDTGQTIPATFPEFTIAAWIKPHAINGTTSQPDLAAGFNGALTLELYAIGTNNYVRLTADASGSVTKAYTFGMDTWHHVVGTGNASGINLYVDGVSAGSYSRAMGNYYLGGAGTFRVGGYKNSQKGWFDGQIDEAILYDRALNSTEVLVLSLGALVYPP